ncbi:kinase-like domain-containing protein [Gigaspora rosea]|uniref:Kinase-like domain-containing protein n=1 Tax=Gigaspora rosea TaxID=44941 RepID=A0A397W4H2_9GLOM|nr:kinase-like domain-containing protein [Gigaspora rosea]
MVFDFKRDKRYGRCEYCDRYNTSKAWCVSCNPLIATQGWTSGNKNVDDCIKELQLEAKMYDELIEWIPFEKLDGIQGINEGKWESVFIATWLDGKRTVSYADLKYTQHRTPSYVVALKKLPSTHQDFLQEFKNYSRLRHKGSKLEVYGMTQDKTNNEYLMVFQYVNRGSLCKFLSTNFNELNWKIKLEQLTDISGDLAQIHEAGYVHCNLHSDNILQHQFIGDNLKSYISGLGLIKKIEDSCVNEYLYGVLPYIAPEVLIKRTYTPAADIYSFGIIMAELSTGIPPYYDAEHDEWLAIEICNGLRPEFSKDTPECYINLANRCMDANPSNRPNAKEIYNELNNWNHIISKSWNNVIDDLSWNNHKSEIKKAFQSANNVISELITKPQSNFQDKFVSKLLNFKNLPEPVNKQQ